MSKQYGDGYSPRGNRTPYSPREYSRGRGSYTRGYSNFGGTGASGGGYSGNNGAKDWVCQQCNFSNFASRDTCYKCRAHNGNKQVQNGSDSSWSEVKTISSPWSEYKNSNKNKWQEQTANGQSQEPEPENKSDIIDWSNLPTEANSMDRWSEAGEITKNLYVEDPEVAALTVEEVDKFRSESFNMTVTGACNETVIPNPVKTFEQAFKPFPEILVEIGKQGFTEPSPIQAQSWPILLQGNDLIGISQTGTGKTLAFMLPALLHICAQPTPRWMRNGPTVLVVAPTRELAQQIEKEICKFDYQGIRCVCVYGQGDKRKQLAQINAKAEIVVATPGRLSDFSSSGLLDLTSVSYLVLDEADRMLDMGFEPQIRKIVVDIRPDRQTVMTSATWPESVRVLAEKLMIRPVTVLVGSLDLKAVHTIKQEVVICTQDEKLGKLKEFILSMNKDDKAIVFIGQKAIVDQISWEMSEAGHFVQTMHGDKPQLDREQALRDLTLGRTKVLLATDVASRGIDIRDITLVLNYDCPRDMEEYVHRVGRTGRAGQQGRSITFITREDWKNAGKLVQILEKSSQFVLPELYVMHDRWMKAQASKQQYRGGNNRYGGNRGNYNSRW